MAKLNPEQFTKLIYSPLKLLNYYPFQNSLHKNMEIPNITTRIPLKGQNDDTIKPLKR